MLPSCTAMSLVKVHIRCSCRQVWIPGVELLPIVGVSLSVNMILITLNGLVIIRYVVYKDEGPSTLLMNTNYDADMYQSMCA